MKPATLPIPTALKWHTSDRVEATSPVKLNFPIGTRVPLHCTASGKLYLSTLPRSRWGSIIQKLNLEAKAKNTITDPRKLIEEITQIAESKVSIDNGGVV